MEFIIGLLLVIIALAFWGCLSLLKGWHKSDATLIFLEKEFQLNKKLEQLGNKTSKNANLNEDSDLFSSGTIYPRKFYWSHYTEISFALDYLNRVLRRNKKLDE